MQKYPIALLALAAALAISPAAKADTFDFSFVGLNVAPGSLSLTGTFTATPDVAGGGLYDITSVTGTFFDTNTSIPSQSITYFPGSGTTPDGLWFYDGLFCPSGSCSSNPYGKTFSGSVIDIQDGLVFDAGTYEINIWGNGGNSYTVGEANNGSYIQYNETASLNYFPSNPSVSATPEPSSLLLLGTGLFGLAFVAFRKAKSTGAFQTL